MLPLTSASVAIVKVLWTSVAATIVATTVFALTIRFIIRCSELRMIGRRGASFLFGALSALALALFVATVVYGLVLLTQKS